MTASLDSWIPFRTQGSQVRCRVFCFPHAGGNAQFYRSWRNVMPPEIDFCPVELPGRAARLDETAYSEMADLVAAMSDGLAGALNVPFAFFGHSIGACIAFEAARHVRSADGRCACHLFVSARAAPKTVACFKSGRPLSDADLRKVLRQYGGTPAEVTANRELMAAILPILRADLLLADSHVIDQEAIVACPITAFCGSDDMIGPQMLEGWDRFTSGGFRRRIFRGGHFFFLADPRTLIEEIVRDLYDCPDMSAKTW